MTRSLFLSFFLRIAAALAVAAGLLAWRLPGNRTLWLAGGVLLIVWTALHALLLSRAARRSVARLSTAAATVPKHSFSIAGQQFSDFDDLAQALADASQRVEAALASAAGSRRELEMMIDSMEDAVVAVDAAGRIQWINEHMRMMVPGDARAGHALVEIIRDPDVLQCVRNVVDERVAGQRRSNLLLPGRIIDVSASPTPGGGAVAVLRDVTRIEQVERTQRDFVANVSHELRTPLTSISGYVETLLDHEHSLSEQAREFLTTILKNTSRMVRLTSDLLVMAQVESSSQELRRVPTRADVLVRDAMNAMAGLAHDRGACVEMGEVTESEVMVNVDAILQVLNNLIENGIKYGVGRADGHARVVVSAVEMPSPDGKPVVEFQVHDFGPGIASEHLSRIFERFYRVDKARSRESGGTGLGLAIARHVVEQHGGAIWAKSEMNEGTVFLFTLPRA